MNKKLHCYAVFLACLTFILVIAGGLVTSTGSSLSVPDWPLSFGTLFPKMEGGVFYEHGHRMIAGTVGILTFILVGWLVRAESRPYVRYMGFAALLVVLIQATLGGITVLYRLPPPVSIAHACLGQIFFCLIVSIAYLTHSLDPLIYAPQKTKLQRIAMLTLTFIFFQLIAGATMRHTGKALHVHLTLAVLVVVHVLLMVKRAVPAFSLESGVGRMAAALPVLLVVQMMLGYVAWRTGPVAVTTAHVAIGALLFAGTAVITLRSFQNPQGAA